MWLKFATVFVWWQNSCSYVSVSRVIAKPFMAIWPISCWKKPGIIHKNYKYVIAFFLCRHACTETKINSIDTTGKSNSTGPIVYLLKLLVNHGGFSCLTKIVKDTQLMWMVPEQLEQDKVKVCYTHHDSS